MTDIVTLPFLSDQTDIDDWEVLNILIGQIYESVLHPEQWNETLAQIRDALCPLNWDSAFILWESQNPPRARFVAASGLAAGVQDIYANVFGGNNLWSQRISRFHNGSVVDSDEISSREEVVQSPLFRDFLKPWGIDRLMAVLLDRRGGERLGMIMAGPSDRDLGALKRGLRVLAPHMQRAMRISDRIASLKLAEGAALLAANQSPFGVISLDQDCTIMAANNRASSYERAGIITTSGGRLAFVHSASQKNLVELAQSLPPTGKAFNAIAANGTECPVLGARLDPQSALRVGGIAEGTSMIITLGNGPGETPVVQINQVKQWYGLTPSEARLAVALGSGLSLADYAAERANSINAARFLLKSVFRKTGATSQAQLTAMLARLPIEAVA